MQLHQHTPTTANHHNNYQTSLPSHTTSTATESAAPPPQPQPPQSPQTLKRFPTHKDTTEYLNPKIVFLCETIATTPSLTVETVLSNASPPLSVSQSDVETVLRHSYSYPSAALRFFRWSASQLNHSHSPYAWNLVVDLLGKNLYFEAMWDAIKSMRKIGIVSLATFASVFSSYVVAGRVKEAVMSFEVMNLYGCNRNVVALNALISAICRDGRTLDAVAFLRLARYVIKPDADTYAILLEGWEKESDVVNAKQTFAEMVTEIGWDPDNKLAYDAFLSTLLMGRDGLSEAMKSFENMVERGCHPGMKFFRLAIDECVKYDDVKSALFVWDVFVRREGLPPDSLMYDSMVVLNCYANNVNEAQMFFHEMVSRGGSPRVNTCNLLFRSLIKNGKAKDLLMVFNELMKKGGVPDQAICAAAISLCLSSMEPMTAMEVWKFMVENYTSDLEETGNSMVVGLCDLGLALEAVNCAEDLIGREMNLSSSTLSKLKQSLAQERKDFLYDALLRKVIGYQV